jgi:cardiolipin synthase
MQIRLLIDSTDFWATLRADILAAKEYIYVQSLSFEGDKVGHALTRAMLGSSAKDRRIIADELYTKHILSDKFVHDPRHWFDAELRNERAATVAMLEQLKANGVGVRLANPVGRFLWKALARNHKKMIVIDDDIAFIGGFNFSEHNFEWHDMMIRFTCVDVARFLRRDFLSSWEGEHLNASVQLTNVDIHALDGKRNAETFATIFDLIEGARESIYVESPYITYTFFDSLMRAQARGADVRLVTPRHNNWAGLREYTLWASRRAGVAVRMYPNRMSHLKAMLIDDAYLVVGSSNFDFQSVQIHQEIIAVITAESAISAFKKLVAERDWDLSIAPAEKIGSVRGHYHALRLRAISWVCKLTSMMLAGERDLLGRQRDP